MTATSVEVTDSTAAVGAQQGCPANGPAGGVPSPQPRSHTIMTSPKQPRAYVKRWSYDHITADVEKHIRRSMALHAKAKQQQTAYFNEHRLFAIGALLAWESLTMGWQKAGDKERLEALTDDLVAGEPK